METLLKTLPDGRGVWLVPLIMGTWRLTVGEIGSPFVDDAY